MSNRLKNQKFWSILQKRMPLARKFMISVGIISLVLLATDVYLSMKQDRELTIETTKDWTLLLAEDVRTSLNMLMKEDRMDLRFALFESMKQELEGLEEVRVIRAPNVSEMLRREREEIAIPREEKALRRYRAQIAEFEEKLKTATNRDEKIQWSEEIEVLRQDMARSLHKIDKMRNARDEVRKDEAIADDLDRKVIETGKPVYRIEGDHGRVVIPYTTRKDCMRASGCHHLAKEGDVLGAISMSFSLEHINKRILMNNLTVAGYGILKLVVVLLALMFIIAVIVLNPLRKLKLGAQAIADGDLKHVIDIDTGDELQDLAENFNAMGEKLFERTKLLSDSKDYVDSIISSMIDMLIVLEPDGTIARVNGAACALLGYSKEGLIGKPFSLVLPGDQLIQKAPVRPDEMLTPDSFARNEKSYVTKGGKHIPVLFSASAMLDEHNALRGIVCVARDISERKNAEMELVKARHAAEQSSRLKSEFLANMSHELRTPLNGAIGMTTLALDSDLNELQRHYVSTAQKCAHSLLDIINDILDFSKIEAGMLSLDTADFNLHRTIEGIADTLAANAYAKGIELACLVHYDVPSLLTGDSGRVRQILLNLGSNAIKFTDKGEVVIRAELKEETDEEVTVLFSVTDSGVGIPKEKQDTIFQPFVQADGSTTRLHGGTGLGLSISRELARMMNGEIGVESEPGKGSRFWFTAVFQKQTGAGDVADTCDHDVKGMRVLIVDDSETNRIVLLKMLEGFGCIASAVGSGIEAIQVLKESLDSENPFRLVLLDMHMPEMDGEQTLANIMNTQGINEISIVILASLGNRGDVSRLKEKGCDAYLIKPVKQSLLYDVVATVKGKDKKSGDKGPVSVVTRHSIAEEKLKKIEMLLVEDNPINKKIMAAILKKAGFSVDIAGNGFLAVEAIGRKNYDLIFLDLNMSFMTGFETARRIREKEKGERHQTIIALASETSQNTHERCLEAGMEDCISELISPRELFTVVGKWIEVEGLSTSRMPELDDAYLFAAKEEKGVDERPVDPESAMRRLGNDSAFYKEMLREFLDYLPEKLKQLAEDLDSGHADRIQKHADDIKGAAGNLSAERIFFIARTIEQKGRDKMIEDIRPLVDDLKHEVEKLEKFVATWK